MLAQANGYVSFAATYETIINQKHSVPARARRRLLKELVPVSRSTKERTDLVGLPHFADVVASVARMIRVLLLGYTAEESDFLQSRARLEIGTQRCDADDDQVEHVGVRPAKRRRP